MNKTINKQRLSELSLPEIAALQGPDGAPLQITFLSLGSHLPGMKPNAVIKCPGSFDDEMMIGDYPAWVMDLIAGRVPAGKHFILSVNAAAPGQVHIQIIEEKLQYLIDADMFRDGGSLEAVWETNYGNTWALYLVVKRGGDSRLMQYDYLYNCRYNDCRAYTPVLRGTEEDAAIMQYLDTWLDEEFPSQYSTSRDLMEKFSRLKSLYGHLNRRTY